jgi:hypothetical protein
MIWPFPLVRNYRTNKHLSALFLEFARRDDLNVTSMGAHNTKVSCPLGTLKFWTGNAYYAWADEGSFEKPGSAPVHWVGQMPSRWAVLKMANAIDRQRFKTDNKGQA